MSLFLTFALLQVQPSSEPGADIHVDDAHEEQKRDEEPGAPSPARQEMEPASEPPKVEDDSDPTDKKFTLSAYVETFYQYNFNNPGNGISNYRGFDTRHNALTLANAVIDTGFRAKSLLGRLALQFGHTPSTYYAQEPSLGGADGAGETDASLWRFLQRASIGWQATTSFLFEAGLFLTNLGVETMAVKDNWNWSRTNAMVRLPNYSSGVKATWNASRRLDVSAGVFNGWNTVTDNNDEKSLLLQAQYRYHDWLSASFAYYGGVEREGGAVEGRPWRHAFDLYAQAKPVDWFEVAVETNGGWEDNRYGLHPFAGGAVFTRLRTVKWLWLAPRVDTLWEDPSANALGASNAILTTGRNVTSFTGTLDARPVRGLSLRVELRHDLAQRALYFRSAIEGDGKETPYVPNARSQTTLLGGAVAWF